MLDFSVDQLLNMLFYLMKVLCDLIPCYFRNFRKTFKVDLSATGFLIWPWNAFKKFFSYGLSATIPTNSPEESEEITEGGTTSSNWVE